MRWALAAGAALVLGGLAPSAASAEAIKCGTRLVSVGDTALTLRARCGAPDHLARYPIVHRTVAGPVASTAGTGGVAVQEEVQLWTYVGDAGDLWRVVRVRRGIVRSVKAVGRPHRKAEGESCTGASLRDRATVGEVRLVCGAPVDRSRWIEERRVRRGDGWVVRTVVRERWTYDPGPGRLLRVIELVNGELVSVTTAERSPS